MAIADSPDWSDTNLAHRFTVSFFKSQYGDDPAFVTATKDRKNSEMLYYNAAAADNETNATICAGLMVNYMEAQGIPYHAGRGRAGCFGDLSRHLKRSDGTVLRSADIVDHYFRFLNEVDSE